MAVRIRMKKMGRKHRPFFRIVAVDGRRPRDGRVLEELGTYDPMVADTDARTTMKTERISYWLSVGAQPSEKCAVLIKKYGENGTHLEQQKKALDALALSRGQAQAREAAAASLAPVQPSAPAPEAEAPAPAPEAPAPTPEPVAEAAPAPEAEAAPAPEATDEEKSEG